MRGAVGVGVAADGERQPGRGLGEPARERRRLLQHVRARRAVRGGRVQRARALRGEPEHAVPDPGRGDVDGEHGGAPAEQPLHRAHLRAGAEDGDGAVGQVQPLRVRDDLLDGRAAGRLDGPGLDPGVQLPAQRVAPQLLPAVGHDQLGRALALAAHGGGPQRGTAVADGVGQRPVGPVLHEHGAGRDGVQPGAGDGERGLRRARTRGRQRDDVPEVAAAPVLLPPGRRARRGVDRPERLRDDAPGDRGAAALPAVVLRELDPRVGPAHRPAAVTPPSTTSTSPVIHEASSDSRNAAALAVSSGTPSRFIG